MANVFKSVLEVVKRLQSKTVTAGTTATTVSPDVGYDGIDSVTVNPTPSQSKTATPSSSQQTITPDAGNLLSSVVVEAVSTQEKTVTATTSSQNVTPDTGYLLSKVTVSPQSHTGTSSTYSSNGTKDLGANHNIRYVPISVSSTPAISSRVGYEKWYYNQSTYYNNQYVTVSFSGLSTSRPNYLLVIYGRNYETTNDVSASANSGTLSLINSDTQNWKGGSWVYIGYKLYKWTVSSSSASVSINRGTSNVAAIYNISAWN